MSQFIPITDEIRSRIAGELGADCVLSGEDVMARFDHDASKLLYRLPEMVVEPDRTGQVQRLLQLANEHRFAVTPRGAGTGLAGGCVALSGGVVLSLARMNRIRSVDPLNLIAEVESGVITKVLRDTVRKQNLFYPPDPASMEESTVGGNAATNAGGPACVKYGTTRDYVLGLEVVLASGELIRTGVKTRKGVVGYDLNHLMVGSEGTLGVITALTLKLIPAPPSVASLVAIFPSLRTATETVAGIMSRGHLPSAIEFIDNRSLALITDLLPFSIPGKDASLLLIETDGVREQTQREIEIIGAICKEMGATHLLPAMDEAGRERLWWVRRQTSLRIQESTVVCLPEDVAVPIGRIADLVDAIPAIDREYGVEVFAFGHAGDGNIHLNITATGRDRMDRVEAGVQALLALSLEMGGTISGEHGIGQAKMKYLPMELSPQSIRLQGEIKKVFDPNGILNPGKIFEQRTANNEY